MNSRPFLWPEEVAERLSLSVRTLADWRVQRRGPPTTKVGRRVVYPADAFYQWEREQTESAA